MNINEVKTIIRDENLDYFNLKMDGGVYPDEVVLLKKEDCWLVGITDERATIISKSIHTFKTEEEACDDFIKRLRSLNEIMKLSKENFF